MSSDSGTIQGIPDTVADLRKLYRAAEARGVRLRLLLKAGRDLASADNTSLDALLASSAQQAALFAGYRSGRVEKAAMESGVPLIAPGNPSRTVGTLLFEGPEPPPEAHDKEDDEALAMLAQLMAAAIDRVEREKRLETVIERLVTAQEDERRRLSRDLHDGFAQLAASLFRRIEAFKADLRTAVPDKPEFLSEADDLSGLARNLTGELRAVIAGLRPTLLDDLGLSAAVAALLQPLTAGGYDTSLEASGPTRWPPTLETAFFRIAQEALSNIAKHTGRPCTVDVELTADPDAGIWRLIVRDDGPGFAMDRRGHVSSADHIGLDVMAERMTIVGGHLKITSAPGQGVVVEATVGGQE